MQVDFLKDIVSDIAGESAVTIVDILYNKNNVNEFLISKKLDLTINQTRNILYKLSDEGLVSFIRKKDKKKGGWYTYFWTLDTGKALELLRTRVQEKLNRLTDDLNQKKVKRFYYDPEVDVEYTEEEALEQGFISPETGGVLELRDNFAFVEGLEREVVVLKRVLGELDIELGVVEKKDLKAKDRRLKLEAKKKLEKRREAARKRARTKKKAEKNKPKKKIKKPKAKTKAFKKKFKKKDKKKPKKIVKTRSFRKPSRTSKKKSLKKKKRR